MVFLAGVARFEGSTLVLRQFLLPGPQYEGGLLGGISRELGGARAGHLVVAHISENNNSRQKAEAALLSVLDSLERVVWAEQGEGFDWLPVL